MSKKEGKGLKSFNKGFQVPDTYIIIFLVVVVAALVVAMAQGIMQVLGGSDPTTPTVINTIMYNISNALSGVSGAVAAVLMYLFQSVFNFFVVSGTGQGCDHNADHGSTVRSCWCFTTDSCSCIPAW